MLKQSDCKNTGDKSAKDCQANVGVSSTTASIDRGPSYHLKDNALLGSRIPEENIVNCEAKECNANILDSEISCQTEHKKDKEDECVYDDEDLMRAPIEVLAEFLSAVMARDYASALNYCKIILQYEPDNKTAQEFYPLIEEKLRLETVEDHEGHSSEEATEELQEGEGENESDSSSDHFSSAHSGSSEASLRSFSSSDEEDASEPHASDTH